MDSTISQPLPSVAIIGSGNVAAHLYKALAGKTRVSLVNPRTLEGWTGDCDVALLAVSDRAIKEVASRLLPFSGILAHTSGSVDINVLSALTPRAAVIYPLQTFSRRRNLRYDTIPFFIESARPDDFSVIERLARLISENITPASSEQRRVLHLASVMVCNFTNHLVELAEEFLHKNGLDRSALMPLLHETIDKLDSMPAHEAQTGPAVRNDMETVTRHAEMLSDSPLSRDIYLYMSKSITNHHTSQNKTQ